MRFNIAHHAHVLTPAGGQCRVFLASRSSEVSLWTSFALMWRHTNGTYKGKPK